MNKTEEQLEKKSYQHKKKKASFDYFFLETFWGIIDRYGDQIYPSGQGFAGGYFLLYQQRRGLGQRDEYSVLTYGSYNKPWESARPQSCCLPKRKIRKLVAETKQVGGPLCPHWCLLTTMAGENGITSRWSMVRRNLTSGRHWRRKGQKGNGQSGEAF